MRDGEAEVFPRWEVSVRRLADGCRAAGIIFVYFLPFLTLFWALAAGSPQTFLSHAGEIVSLTLCVPLFLPVTLPALILIYPLHAAWIDFDRTECVALLLFFGATVFILPAAFMRVALTRRFAAALNVGAAVSLIRRRWKPYIEAWLISVAATAIALVSGPFSPWMILWSYLVIGFAFNEVLGTGPDSVR